MKYQKIGSILVSLILIFFIGKQTGLLDIIADIEKFQVWIGNYGALGYIVFLLTYIFACVFMLPGSVFTIAAGIVFGPVKGGILALVSATIGASIAFLLARYLFRNTIVSKFSNNPLVKKIDDGVTKNGTSFLILTRLVPVFPFSLQNYAYGLTAIPLSTYSIVSFVTMAPGAFIYAYMAGDIVTNGISLSLLVKFAIAGLVLFSVSLIPKYIAKKKGINMDELTK